MERVNRGNLRGAAVRSRRTRANNSSKCDDPAATRHRTGVQELRNSAARCAETHSRLENASPISSLHKMLQSVPSRGFQKQDLAPALCHNHRTPPANTLLSRSIDSSGVLCLAAATLRAEIRLYRSHRYANSGPECIAYRRHEHSSIFEVARAPPKEIGRILSHCRPQGRAAPNRPAHTRNGARH